MTSWIEVPVEVGPLQFLVLCDDEHLADFLRAGTQLPPKDLDEHAPLLRLHNHRRWRDGNAPQYVVDNMHQALDKTGAHTVTVHGRFEELDVAALDEHRARGLLHPLRLAVEHWLPARSGLSLHASSVVAQDLGLLVVGPSGAGKSTFARLSKRYFAEEWSVCFYHDKGWWLAPTPFPRRGYGTLIKEAVALDVLIFPDQTVPEGCQRESVSRSLLAVMAQLHRHQTPDIAKQRLELAARLVEQRTALRLSYRPDSGGFDSAVRRIRELCTQAQRSQDESPAGNRTLSGSRAAARAPA